MKKHLLPLLLLSLSSLFWFGATAQTFDEIDMSDVVIIENIEPASANGGKVELVEVPEVEISDVEVEAVDPTVVAPVIPETPEALADEPEIVFEIPEQEPQSPGEVTKDSEEKITVDFPDEEVRTILRNVADLFELNLVIPDTLQRRTSIKLRNVSWRQVFEVVLEPLGFTFIEDRNIIRIKSIDDLTTEPVDTRVFVVNFARAGDIQGSIAPLVDPAAGGQIKVDVRSNALVITERPSRMNKIQEIIGRLDKPTAQVMIETKFVEVTNNDIKNIGVDWASLSGYEASAGPFQREWTRSRESTGARTGSAGNGSNTSRETNSGSINGSTAAVPRTVATNETVTTTFDSLADLASTASTARLDTAVFSADQFRIVLSALKTVNDSKLVANPTVVTLDNQKARIDIVREVPQIEFNFNPETGTREAQGLAEPLRFGTMIEVTPQVNDAGYINLKVVPEVSNQVGVQETQLGPQPIIDVRKAETNVVIKDGFTLAIGGLVQNEDTKTGSKVPLLGSLPGVGRFFRSDSDNTSQRNLIIFITAKTLNPDGTDYREAIDLRTLDKMGITPSEVPGYVIPADEREQLRRLEEIRMHEKNAERSAKAQALIDEFESGQVQPDTNK